MDTATAYFTLATSHVNRQLAGYEPYQVVLLTVVTLVTLRVLNQVIKTLQQYGLKGLLIGVGLGLLKSMPGGKGAIDKENEKVKKKLEASILKENEGERRSALPDKGVPEKELFAILEKWKSAEDKHWKNGKVSGSVYHGGDQLQSIICRAYSLFTLANPLHSDIFPYVRKMEAEVVRMSVTLMNGGAQCCGTMTSGGTESILMAMKTYRDQGRQRGIMRANIVAPVTAHAAFNKAAFYFDMDLISIPVDPKTFRVDVKKMEKAINRNTVVLVGSAVSFPQGTMDPITEIAKLARKHKLNLHVDACLGGFLLPFLPKVGFDVPVWDFRIPEVTSISADPHKYAFAPKGCSVVLYNSPKLREFQYFVAPDWPGGIYGSPSVAGSRPGNYSPDLDSVYPLS